MLLISRRSTGMRTLCFNEISLFCLSEDISIGRENIVPHVKTWLGHDHFNRLEELTFRVSLGNQHSAGIRLRETHVDSIDHLLGLLASEHLSSQFHCLIEQS